MLEAIVLAGSPNDGPLQEVSDQAFEAMIPIAGKPMVEYVLAALEECSSVGRVIVAGPPALKEIQFEKMTLVEATDSSVMENFQTGLRELQSSGYVLVVTSDIPLITAAAVDDFVHKSLAQKGELFYSIIKKECSEARFPDVKRTYVKLKEGTFTGGNLFLLQPRIVEESWSFAAKMVRLRKNPVQMSAVLGWLFTLKLLWGRLTIPDLEKRVGELLRITPKAVISSYPEVGIDVDKPSDYHLMTSVLQGI